jgi:PEGA domain
MNAYQTFVHTEEKSIYSKYRLGRPYRLVDTRTFKLARLIAKALPPITYPFDVDSQYPYLVDANMYGNDTYGDCVIAGRGHHTLRLEANQQCTLIPITTQDVETEYFKETGGPDSGLNILNSLNEWRTSGWTAAGKLYKIFAYAQIDLTNHAEVEDALFLFNGIYAGVNLPISAQSQTGEGKVWDVDNSPNGEPGSWGGHCTYIVALNLVGPVCVTWGARQQMTWAFWDKYYDEAYAVIDNIDSWVDPATDPVNVQLLSQYLSEVTASPVNPTPDPSVSGTVVFNISPKTATIYIDGGAIPGQPANVLLDAGTYEISAKLKGYKTASTKIAVAAGSMQTVTLTLQKKRCWLANLF